MDNEKDIFIKERLQKDVMISENLDKRIEETIKGRIIMEENNINNVEEKESNNTTNKNPIKWPKKLVAIAACLVIVFGSANVYATTKGFDNIFFMIKYLITGEKIEGKDNILSDRDITISYEPINIMKGINIKVKKLQIKENQAKLFINLDVEDTIGDDNILPLKYRVYNVNEDILCRQTSSKNTDTPEFIEDELILTNYKKEDTILKLEIYNSTLELITTINIDIENRTIEVAGEKEALNKISEIELKEFLGYACGLSEARGNITENEVKIDLILRMMSSKNKIDFEDEKYSVDLVNNMVESFCEPIKDFKNGIFIKKVRQNGKEYYTYAEAGDRFFGGECINITNISYCNGIYTVTYTYYYPANVPDDEIDINDYDIYEQTLEIRLNENSEYSKFKVVSIGETTIIKNAKNANNNVINNNEAEKIDANKPDIVVNKDENSNSQEKTNNSIENKILGAWMASKVLDTKGNDLGLNSVFGSGIGNSNKMEFKENGVLEYNIGVTPSSDPGKYTVEGNTVKIRNPNRYKKYI